MSGRQGIELRARIRYAVDNALSKGLWLLLPWMAGGLLVAVGAVGALIWLWEAGPRDQRVPLSEAVWIALTRSLDPGTFGADEGTHFRIAGLIITVIGLLAIALLIGLIANAVDRRLEELRQGRSVVVESDHILVLGVSAKLPLIIKELMEADQSRKGARIVVLAPTDKVELEHLLRREVPKGRGRLVVRRGEPASMYELQQGRPELARGVVIIRPDASDADAEVVKVVLAVCKAREGCSLIPIVAELHDAQVARGLRQALPGQVMTVVGSEVVARVAAQTSRAAGLGALYQELLDFSGDEIYFADVPPALIGRPFADSLLISDNCSVMGVLRQNGESVLCPALDTPLHAGDQLVVLAEDDSRMRLKSDATSLASISSEQLRQRPPARERTLIVGWNSIASRILDEIDVLVGPGSTLDILLDDGTGLDVVVPRLGPWQHQEATVLRGSMIDRETIDKALERGPFDHIIVLCPYDHVTPIQADARSLLALVHLRNSLESLGKLGERTNVVTEVMRGEAVDLALVAKPDDFIVSQRLISLLMAQLVEDPRRKSVLHELLDSHGSQLQLYPVVDCGLIGDFTYRNVIERMARMGVIALGWKAASSLNDLNALHSGLRLNPPKYERVTLTQADYIVLLCPEKRVSTTAVSLTQPQGASRNDSQPVPSPLRSSP